MLLVLNERLPLNPPQIPSNNYYIMLLHIQMMALFIVQVTWFLLPIMTPDFTMNPKTTAAQVPTYFYLRMTLRPYGINLSSPFTKSSNLSWLQRLKLLWYGNFWPPVLEVCQNYEVEVFQPRTLTPSHLGSCCLWLTLLIYPLYPTFFFYHFLIFISPLFSTAPPICSRSPSDPYCLNPLPTSSTNATRHPHGHRPYLPPSSLRHSFLRPAPCACVYRCLPWRFAPPFAALGLHPSNCQPLGIFSKENPLSLF